MIKQVKNEIDGIVFEFTANAGELLKSTINGVEFTLNGLWDWAYGLLSKVSEAEIEDGVITGLFKGTPLSIMINPNDKKDISNITGMETDDNIAYHIQKSQEEVVK